MKNILCFLAFFFFSFTTNAQRFDGQWKGGFSDNSSGLVGLGGNKIDYVLELECKGSKVAGYSYTYFTEGGKKCYTICKLRGTLNKASKEVTVTEIERTKFNTPPDFRNCFQTHILHYSKDADDNETLEGTWIPAPNQTGDCGFGKTLLSRRIMKSVLLNKKQPLNSIKTNLSEKTNTIKKASPSLSKPLVKNIPPAPKPSFIKPKNLPKKDISEKQVTSSAIPSLSNSLKIDIPDADPKFTFEKRSKSLLETINIEKDSFTVDLYDNGIVDGDSISVFYNNKLLLSHKRLSEKPISIKLGFDQKNDLNELTMYAENLGEIPPNTALMVINDGNKRYEVRITSDTEKNGTVGFTHMPAR